MKASIWMKTMMTALVMCISISSVMAQKSIDRLVTELEKRDDVSINSVTKRNPKTRKIVRVVKTFEFKDEKMMKRLIEAFEKDEEYAVTAIKDMPKGRKDPSRVNFTFKFASDNENRTYTLATNASGSVSMTLIINPAKEGKDVSWINVDDFDMSEFKEQMKEFDKRMKDLKKRGIRITGDENSSIVCNDNMIICSGDVYMNGKRLSKGTHTINGKKYIVK